MDSFKRKNPNSDDKYAHDEHTKFRIGARRAKLFGLWAAEQMGVTGDEAQAYAREVVEADLEEPGIEDVLRKVMADFQAKSTDVSEHRARNRLEELWNEARDQVMSETGK